jgi:hypothetical protein
MECYEIHGERNEATAARVNGMETNTAEPATNELSYVHEQLSSSGLGVRLNYCHQAMNRRGSSWVNRRHVSWVGEP